MLECLRLGTTHGKTEEVSGSLVFGIARINTVGSTNKRAIPEIPQSFYVISTDVANCLSMAHACA